MHCGYNMCLGTVECDCACIGCIAACKRFADAVLAKASVNVVAAGVADAMEAERAKRETPDAEPDGSVRIAELQAENHALAAENAKLRAVAEAAAKLQLWRMDDRGSDSAGAMASRACDAALDAALPGWRTK